jgi:uncharacterized membrane protein
MFGVPLHFLVVHFPLVLIVAALVCDLKGDHESGYRCTIWAATGAAVGVLTGLLQSGGQMSEVFVHAGAGILGGMLTVILAMMRYSRRARGEDAKSYPQALLAVEVFAVVVIAAAAITGHRAVLGY